ncbi:hypothetical protein OXT66_01725 [Lentilactobacillus senioris]|uniref:hypothetical protein n=1 Tax=Lentilactobacillus senioris TaxID=931534 RepID=UPI002280152B|nr:hypothetical protein [Lentilactobacillus senioris]MCY9806264.1 hypothetical protein [Lentilactobacillus senioris]
MKKSALWGAVLAFALPMMFATATQAKTYNQRGDALAFYNVNNFKTLANSKYTVGKYSYVTDYNSMTKPVTIRTKKGNKKSQMSTYLKLPGGQLGNTQSIAVTPDGHYAYVMSTVAPGSNTGQITRFNMQALKKLKVKDLNTCLSGTSVLSKYKNYVKVGPKFNTGHGQSLAYNPKNKQLWFVGKNSINANVQRVSTASLKPITKINFRLKSTVAMGENLTFDKKGNAYFWGYSTGSWGSRSPKKSIKYYKGKIGSKSVKFNLVMQGIKNGPGAIPQAISYNPKSNRVYFISDGSIMSIPASKVGHLKNSDVKVSVFNTKREFEGMSFTSNGEGYLLVHDVNELMKFNKGAI